MLADKKKLNKLNISPSLELYEYYITYGGFDNNSDEFDEVFDIDELYENNIENNYWEDQYPNIREKYLQLSNIEGEGSYFYSLQNNAIYDVSWSEMDKLMNGELSPRWKTFSEFEKDINKQRVETMTKKHIETKMRNFAFITLVFGVLMSANFITDILMFAVHTDGAIIYDSNTVKMLFNTFIWCCVGFTPFMLVIMAWLIIDKDEDLDKGEVKNGFFD